MSKDINLIEAIRAVSEGRPINKETLGIIAENRKQAEAAGVNPSGQISIILPGNNEKRAALAAQSAGSGQEIVGTAVIIEDSIRANLVLVSAGAKFLTGLVGDLRVSHYTGAAVSWKGENEETEDALGTEAMDSVLLTPKRLTAHIDVSKRFLTQTSADAQTMLLEDIGAAVAEKLEATILGKGALSDVQPQGLFYTAPTIKGAASWENILSLESAVLGANMKAGVYITTSKGNRELKSTPKIPNQSEFLIDRDGKLNCYPMFVTNNVASGLQTGENEEGIIFGDFSKLVIGQWGTLDLTIDPYTQATDGNNRITINAYFDAKLRVSTALKTGSIRI